MTVSLSMSRLYCRYSHEQYVKLFVRSLKKDRIPHLNYLILLLDNKREENFIYQKYVNT